MSKPRAPSPFEASPKWRGFLIFRNICGSLGGMDAAFFEKVFRVAGRADKSGKGKGKRSKGPLAPL